MADLLCLEPVGGIAGDMFLALALDLGVPVKDLEQGLLGLGVAGWRLEVTRQARQGIAGTHVDVRVEASPGHHAHRAWRDIRALIEASALSARVKERALAVFGAVARAEAKVHDRPVEEVEFHELGAVDSIVDAVGAGLVLELMGSPEVYCAPPPMGSGTTHGAHGAMPVPPPATMEILAGRAVRFEGVGELTTPTGAAIVAALTQAGPFPELIVERVGYGLGTRDTADRPNLLRGTLGKRAGVAQGATVVLEVNLDDASPQLIAWTLEALLAQGALDAWVVPVTMKKGRAGHLLGALAPAELRAKLVDLLLRETPTLGVRVHAVERSILERRFDVVTTPYGDVRVKVGLLAGEELNAAPEYEDCARLARESGVPLKQVLAAAAAAIGRRSKG